jgi:hypothetical protein
MQKEKMSQDEIHIRLNLTVENNKWYNYLIIYQFLIHLFISLFYQIIKICLELSKSSIARQKLTCILYVDIDIDFPSAQYLLDTTDIVHYADTSQV